MLNEPSSSMLNKPPAGIDHAEEDAREFVRGLYRVLLGREPDPSGLAAHTRRYQSGVTQHQLIADFFNSTESRERLQAHYRRVLMETEGVNAFASRFPLNYQPPGEAGRSYRKRVRSGFLDRYCAGDCILDVGYSGYDNPDNLTALPGAIGVDLNYPGYDGITLPFANESVDSIFSSHCLEHIDDHLGAIRDWFRVLKIGGFIVCIVPSQALYEKKLSLPSRWNADHKRMYSPANLLNSFETALEINSFRIRHLYENDDGYNYDIGPDFHANGPYEIELVIEKIMKPTWILNK